MRITRKTAALILIGWAFWACGKSDVPGSGATASSGAAKSTRNFDAWIPFTSEEAGFSVSTPALFVRTTESTPTDAGAINLIRFTAQPDIHRIYIIVVNKIPDALMAGRDPHQMLQGAREGAVSQFQGTITAERQMTLDGKAGLELKQTGTARGVSVSVVSRIFLAGSSMFQIHVISEKGNEDPGAVRHFLDSFRLR